MNKGHLLTFHLSLCVLVEKEQRLGASLWQQQGCCLPPPPPSPTPTPCSSPKCLNAGKGCGEHIPHLPQGDAPRICENPCEMKGADI